MINANQLFKSGRETKIFEVNDNLVVNDFYNETGFTSSSIHGKMSRIQMLIIDVSKGKKEKANIQKYAFTVEEWEELALLFRYGAKKFQETCMALRKSDSYTFTKANPYKRIGQFIEVRKIKISFEKGLRMPKWKVEIHTGKAMQDNDGFGYDTKSYQAISNANFMLDTSEFQTMVNRVNKYIKCWEQFSFSEFVMNRNLFKQRAKENDYNELNMEWNSNPNKQFKNQNIVQDNSYVPKVNQSLSNGAEEQRIESNNNNTVKVLKGESVKCSVNADEKYECSVCGTEIDQKFYNNSALAFGKAMCSNCIRNY